MSLSRKVLTGCLLTLLLTAAPAAAQDGAPEDGTNLILSEPQPLRLLQPLDDSTTELPASEGIQIFFDYFNIIWPYVLGTAAGICVLQVLVAGVQIMVSKGAAGYENGKTRLLWSIAGLIMLIMAGFILRTLNPTFYT